MYSRKRSRECIGSNKEEKTVMNGRERSDGWERMGKCETEAKEVSTWIVLTEEERGIIVDPGSRSEKAYIWKPAPMIGLNRVH